MARYRHVTSGAVVSVRDDKELGSEWVAADEKKASAKKAAPKPSNK